MTAPRSTEPPSTDPLILGIDVGTTMVKAAVFDLGAIDRPLAVGRAESATVSPRPGWSEVDPDDVLVGVAECIQSAVLNVDASRIAAIGVSGTACGAWLFSNGQPTRPAILWDDDRAADVVDRWHRNGDMAEIFARSGNVPFPAYTLPVLAWLADHEPDTLSAADRLLFCKDWVRAWMTGIEASEQTDASYAPFNIVERDWDMRLLEMAGVSDYNHLLPPLQAPDATAPLLAPIARKLGLRPEIPVAVGATDIVAGCVGGGAVRPGHAVTILGTSANSSVVTATPEFEPDQVGIMAAAPQGQWVRTMLNTSGSATLDWMAGLLTGGDVSQLLDLALKADTSDLPTLLPYLAGAGVVSPFVEPKARGAFLGLRSHHGRAEIARATVDGLAFAVADSYASMPTDVVEITAIGGAAQSDLLLQTIADATAARVTRPAGEEFGARGVALLAAVAAELTEPDRLPDLATALSVHRTFEPNADRVRTRMSRYRDCSTQTRTIGGLW